MAIIRYDFVLDEYGQADMWPAEHGEYMKYADLEAFMNKVIVKIDHIETNAAKLQPCPKTT
jgi:hypothetical protein